MSTAQVREWSESKWFLIKICLLIKLIALIKPLAWRQASVLKDKRKGLQL